MATQGEDGLIRIDYGGLGDDLAARGERQIRSSAGCCGGVSKLREGEKLMKSACDQYQTAKQWKKRGETYAKLVALLDEYEGPLKTDKNKIADYHTYAARSFAEAEVYSRAFEHYRAAALVLQIANEYRAAAGVLTELADTYIDAGDKEGAISALNDAADAYDMANSPSTAAQSLIRRAQLLCDVGKYQEAQQAYLSLISSQKLPSHADNFAFRCQLAALVDTALNPHRASVESNDEKLKQMCPNWTRSPERRLIEACYIAYKLGPDGVADFAHACSLYDQTNQLDEWSVGVLLKVKSIMRSGESDESGDDSDAKDSDIDLDVTDDEGDDDEKKAEKKKPRKTQDSNSDSDSDVAPSGEPLTSEAKKKAREEAEKAKATKSRSELFAETLV